MKRFYNAILIAVCVCLSNLATATTPTDFQRADTLHRLANKVYSPAVVPNWIGNSHYFWYENRERDGNCFYLVNAETGRKMRADSREVLRNYIPEVWKKAEVQPVKETIENKTEDQGTSPDKCWQAYIRDNNV